MALSAELPVRRCLWAIPVSDLGGVARHVLDVVTHGIPGWRLVVLAPPGPLAERCADAGAAVLTEPFGPAFGAPRSAVTLRRVIRQLRPAIVHSHLAFADVVAPVAARRLGPAVVSTEHGIARDDLVYHSSRWRSRVMAGVHTVRLRHIDGVVAVSRSTEQELRAKWHPPARLPCPVIPNGVDAPAPGDPAPPGLRIGALARLAPEKGLVDLIDAFALVHAVHPEASLRVAGVGPLEGTVRAHIDRLRLSSAVTLCGYVEAPAFLATIDVLAQLSVWENCSYSILDALAAPTGVVATAVGGNGELLPDHCLVAPGDVARAADRLIEQGLKPDLRPELPTGWQSVGTMCGALASFYSDVRP